MDNKRILVDFDNTLHDAYDGYRNGELYGDPMPDSIQMIRKLIEAGYEPVVFTARNVQDIVILDSICKWLNDNGYQYMRVTNKKIPALAYIDDRAIRFTNWQDMARYFI